MKENIHYLYHNVKNEMVIIYSVIISVFFLVIQGFAAFFIIWFLCLAICMYNNYELETDPNVLRERERIKKRYHLTEEEARSI